jgi:ABC-type transport system involved in cytochrome c biogenesis permease subunit
VTNLYSSAIFIGWGAVIVALILERIFRDGIGAACAGAVGFVTLVIAHHLTGSGDTLEMLQAVLDTNIWLATHVVAITTGYSAMFLAGCLQ